MRTYIEHLKEKPEHVKNNIALSVSAVITFFIFMFWLSGQSISLTEGKEVAKEKGPIESVSALTANVVDAVKTGFGKREVYVAPDIEVLPGSDRK